jgi:hypothetical protein
MDSINKSLENWLNDLNNFSFKSFEQLPDLELYMDQVVTFLEKQLYIFQTSTLDKQITPSMINNYVKGEVLPAPKSKKYSKEHLALIEEICTLKQVLSIAEVKQILDKSYSVENKTDAFNHFNALNSEKTSQVVLEAFKMLNETSENDYNKLNDIALEFAVTANSYINISKRILYLSRAFERIEEQKEKAKKHEEKQEGEQKD